MRVYELARTLGVTIERVLVLCRKADIQVKNALSILTGRQSQVIERLNKEG